MTDPYYADATVTVFAGDCLDVLAQLPDASVDSVVTDPPYGLEFMGKEWDAPWKSADSAVHADARIRRAAEVTPTGQAHSTSAGPYLAAGVNKFAAGLPFQQWCESWSRECLRVLRPGGHLLAFGGTRTSHRLACAVEDAGFEIRDSIAWLYGSGFPKSLDVSKAIDRANGRRFEDRYALGRHIRERRETAGLSCADVNAWFGYRDGCQHWERQDPSGARVPTLADWRILRDRLGLSGEWRPLIERVEAEREKIGVGSSGAASIAFARDTAGEYDITAPATDDARTWQGYGTALKPAHEPIVVARKPLTGTVAANVLAHGVGALNIDGCRIATDDNLNGGGYGGDQRPARSVAHGDRTNGFAEFVQPSGRWPANVVLDESQAAALDAMSGELTSGGRTWAAGDTDTDAWRSLEGRTGPATRGDYSRDGDVGGASRFMYTAKASADERIRVNGMAHATVKPLSLMRWLVRLVTPQGGVCLEPFAGSGTTVEACILEGFRCIAIERETDYLPLITQRIHRRRDPAAYVAASGDDGGLFDLLDGGAA